MHDKIILVSLIGGIIPFLKKIVMKKIDTHVYMLLFSSLSTIIQLIYLCYYKKKIDISNLVNDKKTSLIMFVIPFGVLYLGNIYNNLIRDYSLNKVTTIMQGYDLLMLVLLGLVFGDINKIDNHKILGLLLFFSGIYFYNIKN